jgi:hypothetical protein
MYSGSTHPDLFQPSLVALPETTQQLEGKLKEKVERRLADKISFATEQDVYHGIITQAIQVVRIL